MKYKFVSSGQNEADAVVVNQTLLGRSLRTLAPVNIIGERNSQGDLFSRWTRRSRIAGGFVPGSDVPVGEEGEVHKLEIYSGSTLKRTINDIVPGQPMPAVLQSYGLASKFLHITGGNTFSFSGSGPAARQFEALQRIPATNNFAEATLIATGDAAVVFALFPASKDLSLPTGSDSRFHALLTATGLVLYDSFIPLYSEDATPYAATGVRIRLELLGAKVLFYKNWAGPGTPPLAESSTPITYPLRVWSEVSIVAGGGGEVQKVMMTIAPDVGAVYTAAEQTTDFGSTQSSIKVRAYSRSAIVGYNDYTEATI